MQNKKSFLFFALSFLIFIVSVFFSLNKKQGEEISNSFYYPKNTLKFKDRYIKTKKNERVVLNVQGGEQDKVKYAISDATKIKIISSSHLGVIIERISDYIDDVYICVFNKDYEEIADICYITCYNEILSCENIYLYKEGLNDENINTFIPLGNGIYYLEFSVFKINNQILIEEESKKELKENIEDFFHVEINEIKAKKLEVCYEINVDTKKVFSYEIRKTMSFKIDRANFIYTFQKGI